MRTQVTTEHTERKLKGSMGSDGCETSRLLRLALEDRWHLDRQLDKECSGGSWGEQCKGSRVRAYVENRGVT